MVEKEFFKTEQEAVEYFGVSERTIRRWIKRAGIKRHASGYSRQELEECAIIVRHGATKISPIEIKRLCHEFEIVIGASNKIKSRLKQLLY